jgi:DNA-binding transcriptional regulator YiaG
VFVITYRVGLTQVVAQPNNLPNASPAQLNSESRGQSHQQNDATLITSIRLFRDVIAIVSYTPPMSPLLEDAQRVHDTAGLSDRMIAAATGAKPSTVRGWLAGRSEPTGARAERLIELAEMIKRLALVLRPESIPVWLQRPILALDDEKPIELIARGEYRRVAKLIAEIEYPGVS